MRLRRIGAAGPYEVLAVVESGKTVVDSLSEIGDGYTHAEKMKALIQHRVPRDGPPRNEQQCRALRDGIFEFKTGPAEGAQLRVLWFWDAGEPRARRRLVCVPGSFFKRENTPPGPINRAARILDAYKAAKADGTLIIEKEKK